jgi:hypothetical protein
MAETQEPQGTTSPAATELSTYEWEDQMDAGYGGSAQPTGGDKDSGRGLSDLITGERPTQATPPPTGNPLMRWLKNAARGPVDAVNALANTATEMSVAVQTSPFARKVVRSTPIVGEALDMATSALSANVDNDPKKARAAKDLVVSEAQTQAVYGPKPHDTVGSLIHGTTQFITAALPFGPLGLPTASAAAMGTGFDPYEATVADYLIQNEKAIEKLPLAGRMITNSARALQVDPEDDTPLEARVKKTIEGEAIGRLSMIVLRPVVRRLSAGYSRAKAAVSGTSEAQARADAELARLNAPEPGDVVQAVNNGDGTIDVVPVQEMRPVAVPGGRPTSNVQRFNTAFDEAYGLEPGADPIIKAPDGTPLVKLKLSNKGGDIVEVVELRALSDERGLGRQAMKELTELADEHGVTLTLQASPLETEGTRALTPEKLRDIYREAGFEQTGGRDRANMVRRPGDKAPEFRETGNGHKTTYTDEGAALSDVGSINAVAHENGRAANMFTPDEVALHVRTAEALRAGEVSVLESNAHFNLQSMGTTEAVDAQIGALTAQYGDLFSVAQGRPSVPNDVLHHAASLWAAEVHLDNFMGAMAKADAAGRVNLSLKAALYNAAMKQAGQEVAEIGMLMAAKQGDEALELLARRRMETFLRISESTANFNSELGRGLQALSARADETAAAIRFGSEVTPRPSVMTRPAAKPPVFRPMNPQNLSPERLAAYVRLFARSGGEMRIVSHVMEAMHREMAHNAAEWAAKPVVGNTIKQAAHSRTAHRVVTIFINSIISGFKTMATIATSGATLNGFQASAKVLAGAGTLNKGLAEEGAAQMFSLFYYSRRAMRGAWGAFKENRSLLDGTPPFHVDNSKIMKGIALPGRAAGSLDEFTRTAAYHADEFATAFRQARNEGMSLVDAMKRADYDVTLSIDEATGLGLNPAAAKRAGIPTLSDHLGNDTFIGKIANTMAEFPLTKLVVPFIRPSVNTFRFAWQNTPVLNRFQRDAQAIFTRGGEEATVLHTQTALTGTMMVYAMSKYMDGSITGAGPKDPHLRAEWDRNHQPYSVKIDGEWHSYRRAEPFATFLGLVADGMEIYHEIPDQDRDELGEKVEGVFSAILSAGARNTTSKSWTESLLNAMSALDDKDGPATKRYLRGLVGGMVPYSAAIRQFNPDPVWREVRSVFDGVRAQIPGWSDDLPARYDWSGEKRAKQGSMWNRNLAIFPTRDAGAAVEDELVDSYIRLAPPNPRPYKGIDLQDRQWANKDGKTPYDVWMEKLAASGVRKQVEDLVASEGFQKAPKGSQAYPESLRGDLVKQIVGAAQTVAMNQMLAEFGGPGGFAEKFNVARYVVPQIGKYSGSEAADSVSGLYGIPTEVRR